jgi:hypothetical protein
VRLFPRSWMSDLVRQQSRLRRAGWEVCPDPFILVDSTSGQLSAVVHPGPGADGTWPARRGQVCEILLDPPPGAGGRPVSAAQLLAQVVNWVARPASAGQVHALAAGLAGAAVRATSGPELITELAHRPARPD